MADLRFYDRQGPFTLGDLAARLGATLSAGAPADAYVLDVAASNEAGPSDLCFVSTAKFADGLSTPGPAAILAPPQLADALAGRNLLIHAEPARLFALAVGLFFPQAGRHAGARSGEIVHPSAKLGTDVIVEPGAVIGPDVEIGEGSHIAANAVIGRGVRLGRNSYIGANATLTYALCGDRVILLPGARVGSDGFGFVPGRAGLTKIPHVGRVILQDDVEVGANSTIDRGALGDTVIGEGTKIDDQVHIAHNCVVGRHCIFAGKAALSGSVTVGDGVVFGGMAAAVDHVSIGAGAVLAADAHATKDLAGGIQYGGVVPARPLTQWAREMAALKRLAKKDMPGR